MPCWPDCRDSNVTLISPIVYPSLSFVSKYAAGSAVDVAGHVGERRRLVAFLRAVRRVRRHERGVHPVQRRVDVASLGLEGLVDADEGVRGLAGPAAQHRLDIGAQRLDQA